MIRKPIVMLSFLTIGSSLVSAQSMEIGNALDNTFRIIFDSLNQQYVQFGLVVIFLVMLLYNLFSAGISRVAVFGGDGKANKYGRVVSLSLALLGTLGFLFAGDQGPMVMATRILESAGLLGSLALAAVVFGITYYNLKGSDKTWPVTLLATGLTLFVLGALQENETIWSFGIVSLLAGAVGFIFFGNKAGSEGSKSGGFFSNLFAKKDSAPAKAAPAPDSPSGGEGLVAPQWVKAVQDGKTIRITWHHPNGADYYEVVKGSSRNPSNPPGANFLGIVEGMHKHVGKGLFPPEYGTSSNPVIDTVDYDSGSGGIIPPKFYIYFVRAIYTDRNTTRRKESAWALCFNDDSEKPLIETFSILDENGNRLSGRKIVSKKRCSLLLIGQNIEKISLAGLIKKPLVGKPNPTNGYFPMSIDTQKQASGIKVTKEKEVPPGTYLIIVWIGQNYTFSADPITVADEGQDARKQTQQDVNAAVEESIKAVIGVENFPISNQRDPKDTKTIDDILIRIKDDMSRRLGDDADPAMIRKGVEEYLRKNSVIPGPFLEVTKLVWEPSQGGRKAIISCNWLDNIGSEQRTESFLRDRIKKVKIVKDRSNAPIECSFSLTNMNVQPAWLSLSIQIIPENQIALPSEQEYPIIHILDSNGTPFFKEYDRSVISSGPAVGTEGLKKPDIITAVRAADPIAGDLARLESQIENLMNTSMSGWVSAMQDKEKNLNYFKEIENLLGEIKESGNRWAWHDNFERIKNIMVSLPRSIIPLLKKDIDAIKNALATEKQAHDKVHENLIYKMDNRKIQENYPTLARYHENAKKKLDDLEKAQDRMIDFHHEILNQVGRFEDDMNAFFSGFRMPEDRNKAIQEGQSLLRHMAKVKDDFKLIRTSYLKCHSAYEVFILKKQAWDTFSRSLPELYRKGMPAE